MEQGWWFIVLYWLFSNVYDSHFTTKPVIPLCRGNYLTKYSSPWGIHYHWGGKYWRETWEPSSISGTECGAMGAIIIEWGRVWSHGSHHNWERKECVAMGYIILEGIQNVWVLDGVAISDYKRKGEIARTDWWIYEKTTRSN